MTKTKHWIDALIVVPVITGALACSITSNNTDSDSATDSNGTDSESSTGADGDGVTIYEIQQGMVPVDSVVQVNNVVVTTPVQTEESAVFVQEMAGGEFSGIYVYMYDEVIMGLDLAPGDVINLKGEYTEFFDFSEITVKNPGDIEIVSSGAPPAPAVVSAADVSTGGAKAEAYESVLVAVDNVTVSNGDAGFGQFEVDSTLLVTDFFFKMNGPKFQNGASIDRITGAMMYGFNEFKLAPRSVDDIEGGSASTTDTATATDTDTATATDTATDTDTGGDTVTIYDLQQDKVSWNTPVEVVDVVVTTGLTYKGDVFFVEEMAGGEYSGIAVFVKDPAGLSVVPGDIVTINGNYDEFYDNSQIELANASGVEITGSGTVPLPELVDSADVATGGPKAEAYEGVLVEIENVEVTNPDLMNGEFEVTGGLRLDDLFFTNMDWPSVSMGETFTSVIGVMNYSFDNHKLSPRSANDLTN